MGAAIGVEEGIKTGRGPPGVPPTAAAPYHSRRLMRRRVGRARARARIPVGPDMTTCQIRGLTQSGEADEAGEGGEPAFDRFVLHLTLNTGQF